MSTEQTVDHSRMTPELTRLWLEDKTFRLQPETYQKAFPDWPGAVGLEIEMLPLFASRAEQPQLVPLQGETNCLAAWLRELALKEGWALRESDEHGKRLLMNVLLDESDNLSFEPGGQLEFSSKPYGCLSEAITRTRLVQSKVDRHLKEVGNVTMTQVGLNPWHTVEEIGLQMNKSRYIAMNEFFSAISPFGPRMMRQTCTVQVNLDFGRSEVVMAKRYLASLLLAPFSGAVFNNSAMTAKASSGMTGLRSKVWRHMDPTRTGVPDLSYLKRTLSKEACVQTYFDFVMAARVVFVTGLDYRVMHQQVSWADWMRNGIDGVYPDASDFETHMSLLFPEVRARGFLELRSVDCQSRVWQFVPAGWWTGLLYDAAACDQVIELLLPYETKMTELLDAAAQGLTHPVLNEDSKKLMTIAFEGLKRLPGCYYGEGTLQSLQAFAEQFTMRGRVPSQDVLDEFKRQGALTLDTYRRVEERWNSAAATHT